MKSGQLYSMHVLDPLFKAESHNCEVEYINVDDVIGYCLRLMNKIEVDSHQHTTGVTGLQFASHL